MCGIFGYVGKKTNTPEMVLDGLKLLEYRGYDSWGIAVKVGTEISVDKRTGKIGDAQITLPESTIGIGHTRWATHGGVTVENAHPHLDCNKQIAVIHNGIIENYAELKEKLLANGHIFISETDTEVAAHLIEENLTSEGFASAVRDSFNQIKGFNALVVLNSLSQEIVAAKNGSPIVIGKADDGLYIASDVSGIIKYTRNVLFLEDNRMAIMGHDLQLISLPGGEKLEPEFHVIDWKFEETEKGDYPHYIIKEIHEQPKVLRNIALTYGSEISRFAGLIEKAFGTFMIGCGTASYAALSGTYLFSKIAKKHVNFSIASEFNYLEDYLTPESLLIPISQSGETIDVVESVNNAKKHGAKIASVVNVLGSTLYRMSDSNVLLGAGPERAVIATKSFIAMVSVMLSAAYTLAGKQQEGQDLLHKAADDVERILKPEYLEKIEQLAVTLREKNHVFIIGRGVSYATSLEAALKLKETCYIHAEGFAGGELKHGVIALIEEGTPCIVFAPDDETYDAIVSNAQEVKARGGNIIGIGPRKHEVFTSFFETADAKEATMISQVVISQLLAYYLALKKGITDPDKPRNLAKSVTVK
jgi:glucosamine--fructose-6-phosphate aminotransferase (isomerizing)